MVHLSKSIVVLIATAFFIAAFTVNTWYSWEMFRYNLIVVASMQKNKVLHSQAFIFFMNIVSNLFNPLVCAGYIIVFYMISHHRFKILVFLIWFIILSVFLTFLKTLIQQPRPYWINKDNDRVKMLEWTCYTEFGCPSGHSMLGLVLIEFIVRYFIRVYNVKRLFKALLIVIGVCLQGLVVFSRIFLGMHAINQVLFGITLGLYFLVIYYTYMKKNIIKMCQLICRKSFLKESITLNIILIILMIMLSILVTFIPKFKRNEQFYKYIISTKGCEKTMEYLSFQYRCFEDSSLMMAAIGIIFGIRFLKNPSKLMKVTVHKRNSKEFLLRVILTILMALIPLGLLMNPLWKKIELSNDRMAIMLYFLQGIGLLTASFILVGFAPTVLNKLKLEHYHGQQKSKQILYPNEQFSSENSGLRDSQLKQKKQLMKSQDKASINAQ